MPVLTAAPGSLLLALTLGCGGDELGGTLADIEDIYARAQPLLEQAATNWGNTAQQALRTAYEDDTWDLLTGGMVSPRSALMDAKRRAETQLMRLEAGCAPSPVWGADDDCEGLGSTDSEGQ